MLILCGFPSKNTMNESLKNLEIYLNQYDQLFLLDLLKNSTDFESGLSEYLQNHGSDIKKRILILSDHALKLNSDIVDQKLIPAEDLNTYLTLWRTYEFSDRFTVITDDSHFGNMFNYVENGIVSMDDLFSALLL